MRWKRYLSVIYAEMSERWGVLQSSWECDWELARGVYLAEQYVCDGVACCITKIPGVDNSRN